MLGFIATPKEKTSLTASPMIALAAGQGGFDLSAAMPASAAVEEMLRNEGCDEERRDHSSV